MKPEPVALAQQHSGTYNFIIQIKGQYQREQHDGRIIFLSHGMTEMLSQK